MANVIFTFAACRWMPSGTLQLQATPASPYNINSRVPMDCPYCISIWKTLINTDRPEMLYPNVLIYNRNIRNILGLCFRYIAHKGGRECLKTLCTITLCTLSILTCSLLYMRILKGYGCNLSNHTQSALKFYAFIYIYLRCNPVQFIAQNQVLTKRKPTFTSFPNM
jgi:hypothetical protein